MSKRSTAIAATLLIAAAAASAQVQETTPLTRQAVIAELVAARNSGELAALQAEKGVGESIAPARTDATTRLPRQAVLTVKPAEMSGDVKLVADQGENAARELGDFPPPVVRRAATLASSQVQR